MNGHEAAEDSIPSVVIMPRRPYLEWARSIPEGKRSSRYDDEPLGTPMTWLIAKRPAKQEEEKAVAARFSDWFMVALLNVCSDRALWPALDYRTFTEWFEVAFGEEKLDTSRGIRLSPE